MRNTLLVIIAVAFVSVAINEPPSKPAIVHAVSKPVVAVKKADKPITPPVAPAPVVAAPVAPQPAPAPVPVTIPTDSAKAFIYAHESGNNPAAINASSGACGLGQALPCSKLPCTLTDYACQDAWFTNYALQRYGSWAAAYAFWVAHSWW